MKKIRFTHPDHQAGFTIVEVMVGLAIGLLASVVIMQVLSVFEGQKRNTTGSADAQTNGSIALFNIGREIQGAGYPLIPSTNSGLECATLTINGVADTGTPNSLTPALIADNSPATTPAGAITSDIINIRYGNSLSGGVPSAITAVGSPTPNDVTLSSNLGCAAGDTTLVINGTACAMSSVSSVSGTKTLTLANITGSTSGGDLSCLGQWNSVQYRVNNGNLERNGVPTVAGIVNIQVQYGVSATPNSNLVTAWVNANAANADGINWGAPSLTNRNRIKAIRIAVVARNAKLDPDVVTTACSSIIGAAPTGLCAWEGSNASPAPVINLNDPADLTQSWAHYRYKVFETIIPLRNVIWSKNTL